MTIIKTANLHLRVPCLDDAETLLALFNQADCLKYIGDKNIHTSAESKNYIQEKLIAHQQTHGFCLYAMELSTSGEFMGICGLIKRDSLPDIDIGFAILSKYQGKGYVSEAAVAVKEYARHSLGLKRLVAITDKNNTGSKRVLEKIGMNYVKAICFEPEKELLDLYELNFNCT